MARYYVSVREGGRESAAFGPYLTQRSSLVDAKILARRLAFADPGEAQVITLYKRVGPVKVEFGYAVEAEAGDFKFLSVAGAPPKHAKPRINPHRERPVDEPRGKSRRSYYEVSGLSKEFDTFREATAAAKGRQVSRITVDADGEEWVEQIANPRKSLLKTIQSKKPAKIRKAERTALVATKKGASWARSAYAKHLRGLADVAPFAASLRGGPAAGEATRAAVRPAYHAIDALEGKRLSKSEQARLARALTEAAARKRNGSGGADVQTLIFDRSKFTAAQAKAWAKAHGFKAPKVDTTTAKLHIRQAPMSQFRSETAGTIPFKPGVQAVIAVPRIANGGDVRFLGHTIRPRGLKWSVVGHDRFFDTLTAAKTWLKGRR